MYYKFPVTIEYQQIGLHGNSRWRALVRKVAYRENGTPYEFVHQVFEAGSKNHIAEQLYIYTNQVSELDLTHGQMSLF